MSEHINFFFKQEMAAVKCFTFARIRNCYFLLLRHPRVRRYRGRTKRELVLK